MKLYTYSTLLLVALLTLACSSRESAPSAAPGAPAAPAAPSSDWGSSGSTPAATAAVQHYICPNNCAGSGSGVTGTCPTCGTQYIHNAAFHNQQPSMPQGDLSPVIQQPTTPAPTTEPAQNAAGVYHYTCSNGCAGGSGTAGNCATCGGALAHNQAYHQ